MQNNRSWLSSMIYFDEKLILYFGIRVGSKILKEKKPLNYYFFDIFITKQTCSLMLVLCYNWMLVYTSQDSSEAFHHRWGKKKVLPLV